jgi:RNA polymerase sigma-70 factor, ECF subfamily
VKDIGRVERHAAEPFRNQHFVLAVLNEGNFQAQAGTNTRAVSNAIADAEYHADRLGPRTRHRFFMLMEAKHPERQSRGTNRLIQTCARKYLRHEAVVDGAVSETGAEVRRDTRSEFVGRAERSTGSVVGAPGGNPGGGAKRCTNLTSGRSTGSPENQKQKCVFHEVSVQRVEILLNFSARNGCICIELCRIVGCTLFFRNSFPSPHYLFRAHCRHTLEHPLEVSSTTDMTNTGRPTLPSLRVLFAEHAPHVFRTLRRLGVREADVDDACQEVFLVVHRKQGDFEGRASVKTWIFAIAIRVAHGYRRRRTMDRADEHHEPSHLDTGESAYTKKEMVVLLDRALGELDEDKRDAFVLYELEQCTVAEVADALRCPLQTAYSRINAARDHIQASLRRTLKGLP